MKKIGESILETYRLLFRLGSPSAPKTLNLRNNGQILEESGWKVAHVIDPYVGRFAGLAKGTFIIDDIAQCASFAHRAPQSGCRCGFHAFHNRDDARKARAMRWGSVLLKVELYGEIVRHEKGSRAAEQVVTGIYPYAICEKLLCKNISVGLSPIGTIWVSACDLHLKDGVSLSDLHQLHSIEVLTSN